MEKNEVIKSLIAKGAELVKGVKVRNVTVTPQDNYVRLAITLDKEVKGMVQDADGNWGEGKTKVIFVSAYSLGAILKDNDEAAFAVNYLNDNPNAFMVLLSRATLNVIVEPVVSGEEYRNPWSDAAEARVFDHDTFIYHVTDITLGDFGRRALDKIADKLLGF